MLALVRGTFLPLLLVACQSGVSSPVAVWNPDSPALFDAPWPTDDRLVDGHADFSGFPNPHDLPLLNSYADAATEQDGWGTNAPIYFRFDGEIDTSLLPTPAQSARPDSSLVLLDVDPDSAHRGERFPVQWEWHPAPSTYVPGNLLAVAPVFGFPLRPATTYALIVTHDVAGVHPAVEAAFEEHPDWALLADALPDAKLKRRDVAIATIFTTMDPVREMHLLATDVKNQPVRSMDQELIEAEGSSFYRVFEGTTEGPLYQHGEIPYATEGGGFVFEGGEPVIAEWVPLRIAVSSPKDLSDPPPDGWPIVLYAHGTGGDFRTFSDSGSGLEVASVLARAGMLGIGFDQPLHGPRGTEGTDPELHSFNYLNLKAARANFRQGALDIVWLVRQLRDQKVVFTTDTDETIPVDSSKILYMGHSHGGLTGALAVPWIGDDVHGAVLSGAGGGLAITVVKRKDPIDYASLIAQLLRFGPDERLTPLHPVVGLIQTLVEPTDPINYAPYWHHEDGGFGSSPVNVLLTSGRNDLQTDHETAEALAAAARMPIVSPAMNEPVAMALRQLAVVPSPAASNETAWDQSRVTSALSQWPDADHFVIFTDTSAASMYQLFLLSALDGEPQIDPSP